MNRLERLDQRVRVGHDEYATLAVFERDGGDRLEKVVRREGGDQASIDDAGVLDHADEPRAHDDGADAERLMELTAQRVSSDISAEDDGNEVGTWCGWLHGHSDDSSRYNRAWFAGHPAILSHSERPARKLTTKTRAVDAFLIEPLAFDRSARFHGI